MNHNWAELAFASKKPLNELGAVFIMAPRELSTARIKQLIKTYLPEGNIVFGLAEEDYVLGFEGQPQFKMLKIAQLEDVIEKVNQASPQHKIHTITYAQRDGRFLLEKLRFRKIVLINGSWKHVFHSRPEFYRIAAMHTPYNMVSPFTDEAEARAYADAIIIPLPPVGGIHTEADLMGIAQMAAHASFDYNMQTGVALARRQADNYELIATSYNGVVPYQTYAMHHGAAREKHFAPMHDLNHYDTNHAEVELIIKAQKQSLDLRGTSLFINLLPCPTCARMFTRTDIQEFIYREDHSDGYAVHTLESAGRVVKRLT
jgi:deoxycytidylate deaminase